MSRICPYLCLAVVFLMASSTNGEKPAEKKEKQQEDSPLNVEMKTLDGEEVNLAEKYENKVVLLVNVASECGLTPQYEQLQAMHEKYKEAGLAIVGVPCNQFGGQEPGSALEIREFCTKEFGVEFDLMEKVDVNGDKACALYKWLTSEETNPDFSGKIAWNFEKFLFGRDGKLIARFEPRTKPDDEQVVEKLETALKEKAKEKKEEAAD